MRLKSLQSVVPEGVSAASGDDVGRSEPLAELGHVLLDHLAGRRRRPSLPQLLGDDVGRDDVRGTRGQQREEVTLLGPAERDARTGTPHLERAQHTNIERRHCTTVPPVVQAAGRQSPM